MKKLELCVGQKIRGYGVMNEFGEFDFIPEQTGIRQGATKLVKTTSDYTISETKNLVIIHVRLPKLERFSLMNKLLTLTTSILEDFKKYEF